MKLYFAKYISVEGEVKERDIAFGHNQFFQIKSVEDCKTRFWTTKNTLLFSQHIIKVKLFLCSRDIQVGDKYDQEPGINGKTYECIEVKDDVYIDDEGKSRTKGSCFKVIGEISPEAIWVNEGDEFEENEVKLKCYCSHTDFCDCGPTEGKPMIYKIKST